MAFWSVAVGRLKSLWRLTVCQKYCDDQSLPRLGTIESQSCPHTYTAQLHFAHYVDFD